MCRVSQVPPLPSFFPPCTPVPPLTVPPPNFCVFSWFRLSVFFVVFFLCVGGCCPLREPTRPAPCVAPVSFHHHPPDSLGGVRRARVQMGGAGLERASSASTSSQFVFPHRVSRVFRRVSL